MTLSTKEEYEYKGFHFQRMNFDGLWYIIKDNRIVNRSQYQNDMKSWIDHTIRKKEMEDVLKEISNILGVKYSHYDHVWTNRDYFPNMKLQSPVRIVCYPGMAPWTFAILENLDVITPTSQFAFTILGVYESLKNIEGSTDVVKKYETMVQDIEDELENLRLAKEFLINSNFTWEGIPEKI